MKLTFKQVAEKAGINPSTAAFQRNRFEEFIPHIGEGRHRRYNEESVEVLVLTSKMYSEGKSYEEIKEALEYKHGVPTDIVVSNTSTTQLDVIEEIRGVFQQEISRLESKIDVMGERHDKLLMESIRLLQEKKAKKNWWKILNGG